MINTNINNNLNMINQQNIQDSPMSSFNNEKLIHGNIIHVS
jgi:hypothetical protein